VIVLIVLPPLQWVAVVDVIARLVPARDPLVVGSGQPAGRQGASSAGRCITIAPSSGEILEARVELGPREEAGRYTG
jgi:hypothetical protein